MRENSYQTRPLIVENTDKKPERNSIEPLKRVPPKTYLLVRFLKPSNLSFLRRQESRFFKIFLDSRFHGNDIFMQVSGLNLVGSLNM
jgi:hypothetical protein